MLVRARGRDQWTGLGEVLCGVWYCRKKTGREGQSAGGGPLGSSYTVYRKTGSRRSLESLLRVLDRVQKGQTWTNGRHGTARPAKADQQLFEEDQKRQGVEG